MKIRHPLLLASLLSPTSQAWAGLIPQEYDYSYQVYQEDDDRILVESHYVRGKWEILAGTTFRMQYLNDAISGASPTGAQPGGPQSFLAELEDVRTGILGALAQQIGDHRIELEISQSSENDYLSNGYALSDVIDLNQKNTTLTLGVNYLDDTVRVPGLGPRGKESFDVFAGVSQLLDKNTVVTGNLTLGFSDGYLSDPYKIVQRDELAILEDSGQEESVVSYYRENRPDRRFRQVVQLGARHYLEERKAAIDAVFRYTHDDFGVSSGMVQAEWRQEVGQYFEVVPFVRYYHQTAADFFVNDLNNVDVDEPAADPDGSGPHYSADYRLSALDALSLGLRVRGKFSDNLSVTATYERYSMQGTGGNAAPSGAYPEANILTVGMNIKF